MDYPMLICIFKNTEVYASMSTLLLKSILHMCMYISYADLKIYTLLQF